MYFGEPGTLSFGYWISTGRVRMISCVFHFRLGVRVVIIFAFDVMPSGCATFTMQVCFFVQSASLNRSVLFVMEQPLAFVRIYCVLEVSQQLHSNVLEQRMLIEFSYTSLLLGKTQTKGGEFISFMNNSSGVIAQHVLITLVRLTCNLFNCLAIPIFQETSTSVQWRASAAEAPKTWHTTCSLGQG
eukprot:scpid26895/ scgid6566/ 